jgi:hypothetical protein
VWIEINTPKDRWPPAAEVEAERMRETMKEAD